MPRAPYVRGNQPSEEASENLNQGVRFQVGCTWIELAARPDGVTVREVERHLNKLDSGPSARQGELAHKAEVTVEHPHLRREKCGVYFLRDGLDVASATERWAAWLRTDDARSGKRIRSEREKALLAACNEYAEKVRSGQTEDIGSSFTALEALGAVIRREILGTT